MNKSCTTQSQCWASVVWAVSAPCRDCPKWPGIIPSTEIVARSHQTWSHSCGAQHYPVSIAHAAISSLVFSNPIIANIMFVFLFIYNVDKQKKKQTNFLRVGSNKHVQNANVPALLAPPTALPSDVCTSLPYLLHSQVALHTAHHILQPFAYRATFHQLRLQFTIG